MVSRRAPVGLFLIAPVIAGLGVYAFTGQAAGDPAPGSETPTASATPTATATNDPLRRTDGRRREHPCDGNSRSSCCSRPLFRS